MTGLIPIITNSQEENAVDGRELHYFLNCKTRDFSTWISRRIKKYGFVEGVDYEVFHESVENPRGGRPTKDYIISIDTAKQLAMVEDNDRGKEARLYFIKVEKDAKRLAEEIYKNREKIFQRAQMKLLGEISPDDKDIYMKANQNVNAIVCDIVGVDKKKKDQMNTTELKIRDDTLGRWVDAYKIKESVSHANMVVRMMYGIRQVGKNKYLNKLLDLKG
jgi:phage anti-repressor protein